MIAIRLQKKFVLSSRITNLDYLKSNSTLTTLIIKHTQCWFIGDEGASLLSDYLKSNSTLKTLFLGYNILCDNKIGDEGARALSGSLKSNSALTELNLSGNKIRDKGARALSDYLKTPQPFCPTANW